MTHSNQQSNSVEELRKIIESFFYAQIFDRDPDEDYMYMALNEILDKFLPREQVEAAIGSDDEVVWRGKALRRGDTVSYDERFDDPMDVAIYAEKNGKNVLRQEIRAKLGLTTPTLHRSDIENSGVDIDTAKPEGDK